MWEDVEGQESFPVSAGFELTYQGLLVQEHNYCATTHTHKCETFFFHGLLNVIVASHIYCAF